MSTIINIFGAPGAGKSTIASGLFYQMKKFGYNVELAFEWIKFKVYQEDAYPFKDQIYTFAKQNKQINQLTMQVDYIITDSPLLLSLLYGKNECKAFHDLVLYCYYKNKNYNFVVERNHNYQSIGRYQNEKESQELHKDILKILNTYHIPFTLVKSTNALETIIDDLKLKEQNFK